MNFKNQNYFFLFLSYAIAFLLVVLHRNNSFFWDTVQLASAHATYYFQNQFSSLLLPVDIDSGHIPTFGIYIAFVWKLFGRSLAVSHLAMLPFALGIVFYICKLCQPLDWLPTTHLMVMPMMRAVLFSSPKISNSTGIHSSTVPCLTFEVSFDLRCQWS